MGFKVHWITIRVWKYITTAIFFFQKNIIASIDRVPLNQNDVSLNYYLSCKKKKTSIIQLYHKLQLKRILNYPGSFRCWAFNRTRLNYKYFNTQSVLKKSIIDAQMKMNRNYAIWAKFFVSPTGSRHLREMKPSTNE